MKNKDVSMNILKAISIGLSAAIALMPNATALAAEGEADPDSSGNDTHQESDSSESSSSSSTESVSEASESVSEASSEMSQSEAPAAEEAAAVFTEASEALGGVATEMAAIDQAVAAAEDKADYFDDMQYAAEVSTGFAETTTGAAVSQTNTAVAQTEAALDNANTQKEEVTQKAESTYTSDAAADVAMGEAQNVLDAVNTELGECKTAVDEAQGKLDAAEGSLKVAENAVKYASEAKEAADTAAAEAKDKLISLLEENGIEYNENEDGTVEVVDGTVTSGALKAAIDKAQAVADKAAQDAADAQGNLNAANTEAVNAAQAVADAATEKKNTAQAAYDQSVADFAKDEALEDLLLKIQASKAVVAERIQENTTNLTNFYNANRNLAFNMVKYMLYQDPTIDRDSIVSTQYDKKKDIVQKKKINDKESAVEVAFRRVGSDVVEYRYFDYNAYYRDGSKMGSAHHDGPKDADHIIVVEKIATQTDAEGKATSFGGSGGQVFFSELALDKGADAYQSSRSAVTRAEAALEEAAAQEAAAQAALQNYADLEGAKAALDNTKAELENAKSDFAGSFQNSERLEELLDLIKDQQGKVEDTKGKGDKAYYKQNRILSFYMVEYSLLQQGDVEPGSIEVARDSKGDIEWHTGNGVMNNYGTVTYRMLGTGETRTMYFDYIAYFEDGETVGDSGTMTDMKYSDVVNKNSSQKVDHILVVQKQFKQMGSDGKAVFENKGTPLFNEADFNAGADAYQSGKSRIAGLEKAVSDAQSAVDIAQNIDDLKKQTEAAQSLSQKVNDAKAKVDAAAAELQNARKTSAMNKDKIAELTQQLADARAEYEKAQGELDEAKEKLNEIQSVVDDMTAAMDGGFRVVLPPAGGSGSGSSGSSSDGSSSGGAGAMGGATVTAASAAGGAGTVAAVPGAAGTVTDGGAAGAAGGGAGAAGGAAGGAAVLGERQAPEGAAAAASAGAAAESEVLGERQAPETGDMLEGGVLGERQAPIIQAFENGTFGRGMLFTEEGLKISFAWWFLILILGAKGVQMYAKSRKEEKADDTWEH